MLPIVSINGQIAAPTSGFVADQTGISPLDRGFTLGDGIFETIKVANGIPWYLDRHLQRLQHGADVMAIPYPGEALYTWIASVVDQVTQNDVGEFVLRITLTRGPSIAAGLAINGNASPTTSIVAYASPELPSTLYEHGITANIASARRNDRGFTTRIKTISYAESLVALKKAKDDGFDDTIFLNTYDFVAEASASNVFVCLNGVVITPAITQGILPGITRDVVLSLARDENIPTAEREVHDEELINADEAFLTSSLRGIVPLVKVGNYILGRGTPGLITQKLIQAYERATQRM